jgi:hypothetical protein
MGSANIHYSKKESNSSLGIGLSRLETNIYRPRVFAVKKADIQIRRALLGAALQTESVRNGSNLLWIFLSGNANVVLQSNNEDEVD